MAQSREPNVHEGGVIELGEGIVGYMGISDRRSVFGGWVGAVVEGCPVGIILRIQFTLLHK